jgi:hypothetical protein
MDFVNWCETHWLFCLLFGPELVFLAGLPVIWLVAGVFALGHRVTTGEWPT